MTRTGQPNRMYSYIKRPQTASTRNIFVLSQFANAKASANLCLYYKDQFSGDSCVQKDAIIFC